jgi:hydroxymethylpyrimidine/phosphomethylpyrimidine kinase
MPSVPVALTIAGSDPSGGAGIQADLKTFHRLGVYGAAAITLITVQNTTRVSRVVPLDAALVAEQIDAVLEDLPPRAIKTGALGTAVIVDAIAERKFNCPLVVDPVLLSTHGAALADANAVQALRRLICKAALVTPNLAEAACLAGIEVTSVAQMRDAARRIAGLGARAVLVKGGHLSDYGNAGAIDVLYADGRFTEFPAPRLATRHTHGTGCTFSASITAFLARGLALEESVVRAKRFIHEAIRTNPGLGHGAGPLNHWAETGDPL